MANVLNGFKNTLKHIDNIELRKIAKYLVVKAPKYFWTVDNKLLQKNTIKIVNNAIILKEKFEISQTEFDQCIVAILLADTCYYSATDEVWTEKEIVQDHPFVVKKYYTKKCPNEMSYLKKLGFLDNIFNSIETHESKINFSKMNSIQIFVNLSFYIDNNDKLINSEYIITPEILLFK